MGTRLAREAAQLATREPVLARLACLVAQAPGQSLSAMLARLLGELLQTAAVDREAIEALVTQVHTAEPMLAAVAAMDINAVLRRDPASESPLAALLYQKGFQALQLQRVSHWLWNEGRGDAALYLQALGSRMFQVDIHPACRIGGGVMFDHATGIVAGETCVIGDRVSVMQGVTLGGTGKERGERHPKIGDDVLIGAGAVLLGNIAVRRGARVAAGSVVLADVPAGATVAGVPARVVGTGRARSPSQQMDQVQSAAKLPTPSKEA